MHRFVLLLFILGLGQSVYAAPIFDFPHLTRRLPERTTSPGCVYRGERYEQGENVPTAEPCLNCTCNKAVLVCYLRVCPTSSAPPPGCFAAREVGECCPSLVCGGSDSTKTSTKSDSSPDLRPTFQPTYQPIQEETTIDDSSTTADPTSDTSPSVYDSHSGASTSTEDKETFASLTEDGNLSEDTDTFEIAPTYESSTVSDTTFHTTLTDNDSLVYITSTQQPTQDYDNNLFNDIPGGCMVNGTLYGDGSAMLSSSFCEYCFCIRGKSTCLKPKCNLAIDGCVPQYDSHYSCCPSRYDCSQRTPQSTASVETTMTSITLPETTESSGDPNDCIIDGTIYHQGEVVPDRQSCHNCYCSNSSVVCKKIKCSPPIEGCQPIIPEGHCCPISYRCDYQGGHAGSNSIKGSNLNDNITDADNKGTDIKPIKNYYVSNKDEIGLKADNDRESMNVFHNTVPVYRRLDESTSYEPTSTLKDVGETSPLFVGFKVSTSTDSNVDSTPDYIRENAKTLNIEFNDTAETTLDTSVEERIVSDILRTLHQTTVFQDEPSSTETVSFHPPENVLVGSAETHTLSIEELFEQFFSLHKMNASKLQGEISLEPKRNNSKQPSSIVEIYDSETDIPGSTTTTISSTNITPVTKETSNGDTTNLETSSIISSQKPINIKTTTTKQTADSTRVTNYDEDIFNKEKTQVPAISTILPNIETQSTENFHTLTDTVSTSYPTFATTRRDNEFAGDHMNTHSPLTDFVSNEDFIDQDFLESTLSKIFSTASHLYGEKFSIQDETLSTSPDVSTRHIFSEIPKQTYSTPPDYTTNKHSLVEELKLEAEARPVVFIYDNTRNYDTDVPTKHSQTQATSSLYDTTRNSSDDELKTDTETQAISLMKDATKNAFSDETVKQKVTQSTTTVYTSTKNLNSEELEKQSEIYPTSSPYTTTKNINSDDKTGNQLSVTDTSINHEQSDHFKKEIESISISPIYINNENSNEKQNTQADFESTFTAIKDTSTKEFVKETEIPQTSPAFTTIKHLNSEKNQGPTDTNPTKEETFLTTETLESKLNKITQTPPTTFLLTNHEEQIEKEKNSITVRVPLAETGTQKVTLSPDIIKLPTRINSKLPSFSYIEKADEKINTSVYPRHPVLTDSVVNVYLPAEGRDNVPVKGGDDFTNVGSIYIGAPLSVGGTDSKKDSDIGKPKITQSGGVIFMDPKYTDIDTKTNFQTQEKPQNDTLSTATQNKLSTGKDSSNEKKKGPRNQDEYNQSSTGQGYKIIPFVAEDAIRGQFGKLNITHVVQQGSTEGLPDMVSDFCFIKGRIYMNGEMIGKPDPCELCRCFYGRELCQIQRCPTPPDCIPEKVPGFCCPRFTCGNNATSFEQVNKEKEVRPTSFVQLPETLTSTSRKPDILERMPQTADKQEVKFGIRVRVKPTQSPSLKFTEHTTEKKILLEKTTTTKPEIRTLPSTALPSTTTTTSKKPHVVRPVTNKMPEIKRSTTSKTSEIKRSTTTTTTTTQSSLFPDPWGLLKVSGCNIYGKFFNINDQVEILSGPCSHCICTTNGVECNDIC